LYVEVLLRSNPSHLKRMLRRIWIAVSKVY